MKISELLNEEEIKLLDRKRNLFGCLDMDYLDDILLTKAYVMEVKDYAALRLAKEAVEIKYILQNIEAKTE